MIAGDVLLINDSAQILVGAAGRRIVVPFLAGEHSGQGIMLAGRLQKVQGDRFVRSRILLLLPLPFFAGQAAHIIIEAAGRAVIMLHHRKILETLAEQHPIPVHGKIIWEGRASGKMTGDVDARGDRRDTWVFPEVLAEQVVGRTMGIGKRRCALSVVKSIPEDIAECGQDMVVAIQPEKETARIKQGTISMMPGPVVLGNAHLEPAVEADDERLLRMADAVDVGRHHGVNPKFNLTVESFECKDVGDLSDVFVVPEEDFVMAGNAEMVQLLHSRSS